METPLTTHTWASYGVTAEISVTDGGVFFAKVGTVDENGVFTPTEGLEFHNETLGGLRNEIFTALKTTHLLVEFVDESGKRGWMRAHHASRRVLLTTMEDGGKGTIDEYRRVYPGNVDPEVVERVRAILQEQDRLSKELSALRAGTVSAEQLFNMAAGENLTGDYNYNRYAEASA